MAQDGDIMTFKTQEDAFQALEEAREDWLLAARSFLGSHPVGTRLTVNEVRDAVPLPDGIDGRVMGVVFKGQPWEMVGYKKSHRATCHKRPISVFERV
jgi:hypothetical protein